MSRVKLDFTGRGFAIVHFHDALNQPCTLQESSSALNQRVWLGVQNNRMCLDQGMVAELLPYLAEFVETGQCVPQKTEET